MVTEVEIVRNEHDVDEDGSLKPTELSAFEYRQQGRREMGRYRAPPRDARQPVLHARPPNEPHTIEAVEPHTIVIITRFLSRVFCRPMRQSFSI